MASSTTSLDEQYPTTPTPQHKPLSARTRHRTRTKSDSQKGVAHSSASNVSNQVENSSAETTPRVSSKVSKINRAPRRALREKRKAIGVCTHLQSMESAGCSSSGDTTEEDEDFVSLKSYLHNEELSAIPLSKDEDSNWQVIIEQMRDQLKAKDEHIHRLETQIENLHYALARKVSETSSSNREIK